MHFPSDAVSPPKTAGASFPSGCQQRGMPDEEATQIGDMARAIAAVMNDSGESC